MVFMLIYMYVTFLLSLSMARWADYCKNIGFWWALFLSFTLSPVAGYIFAKMSGNKKEVIFMSVLTRIIFLVISFIAPLIGGFLFTKGIYSFFPLGWVLVLMGSGLAGASIFVILLVLESKSEDDLFGKH